MISSGHNVDEYTLEEFQLMAQAMYKRKERETKNRILEVVYGISIAFGSKEAAKIFEDKKEDINQLIDLLSKVE